MAGPAHSAPSLTARWQEVSEGGMANQEVDAVGRWSSEELLLRAAWFYDRDAPLTSSASLSPKP